ncbi:MAG: hypothetical protein H7839_15285 [Magnetococcus sp. YQC-5]
MKINSAKMIILLFFSFTWTFSVMQAGAETSSTPLVLITQIQGQVEYSKEDSTWKPLQRNKLLFNGDQVRTGGDGSAKLIHQTAHTIQTMGGHSVIKITENRIDKLSGTLSEPVTAAANLFDNLEKRFAEAQHYTTMRRGVSKDPLRKGAKKELFLSPKYPELVWSNMGAEYTYELVIDNHSIPVGSAGSSEMVRHTITGVTPGRHVCQIKVLKDGQELSDFTKNCAINWMDSAQIATLEKGINEIKTLAPGDPFMLGLFLDNNGLTVAAMDMYRIYFKHNLQDLEMRPMLIKAYSDLELNDLKKQEVKRYQQLVSEKP